MQDKPANPCLENTTQKDTWYITSSIPYVNAEPHIGFAMEMIQADVLARYRRRQGYRVRFQSGADENSLKNVQAAVRHNMETTTFVAQTSEAFSELKRSLNLSTDDFIRTSVDPRHRVAVEAIWTACYDSGHIYKRQYEGLYCVGCEQFLRDEDLIDGRCPEHFVAPEPVSEENYFFRLSDFQDRLEKLLRSDQIRVHPSSRRNEVLGWITSGLDDFSISRSSTRAHDWGITVPGDPSQTIYVWFDALVNYVSALGYGGKAEDFEQYWTNADRRQHVIGKGISRFHALYWPAMLLSAGLPLPTDIFVHGYVTIDGKKISKSGGQVVAPTPLAGEFGPDAVRYYLLRHIHSTKDGDFSRERLAQCYHSELAGQLGNLVHRVTSMVARYSGGSVPNIELDQSEVAEFIGVADLLEQRVETYVDRYAFNDALSDIWRFVGAANKYVADQKPWELAKEIEHARLRGFAEAPERKLAVCLFNIVIALAHIAHFLEPFLPNASGLINRRLGTMKERGVDAFAGHEITVGEHLFPKLCG